MRRNQRSPASRSLNGMRDRVGEQTLERASTIQGRTKTELAVEVDESKSRHGFCPNCISTNIRRAYKHGVFEEFLRLFIIVPFRCCACQYKFYRF